MGHGPCDGDHPGCQEPHRRPDPRAEAHPQGRRDPARLRPQRDHDLWLCRPGRPGEDRHVHRRPRLPRGAHEPLVAEQTEMRRSLLPGLLQSVAYNEAHGTPNVHLYEVGSLFHGRENVSLPKETKSVAGVLSGQWSEQSWNMKYRKLRFFFGKGIVEELLAQLRIEKVRFRPVEGEATPFCSRAAPPRSSRAVPCWVGSARSTPRRASLRHR